MSVCNPLGDRALARQLPLPGERDHKYSRGTVCLVTGSSRYPGAGVLSAGGAALGGAGVVRFAGSARAENLVLSRFPEVVLGPGEADALVIGCGWDAELRDIAEETFAAARGPVVIDAGALTQRWWRRSELPRILTPHRGEAKSLWLSVGEDADTLDADAGTAAGQIARATGCITALKGHVTAVSDGTRCYRYEARTSWPATAGTGDVLAGVIGSVCARRWRANPGEGLLETVAAAVWLHGMAAQIAAGVSDESPGHPLIASDIIECLPKAWLHVKR